MVTHKNDIHLTLLNATSVKNKTAELLKFLTDHNIDIAIIMETWLKPSNTVKLNNYNIFRKDRPLCTNKHPGGGVLIAVRTNIPVEDTPRPSVSSIEFLSVKLKISPALTIGAAYVSPKNKITAFDLDAITSYHGPGYFLIGGDFNAKHKNWNNLNRNANGSTLKNHSELHNFHILHSPTYTDRLPNRTPSNIDIFLTNALYFHECQLIDDLPSNHFPVSLKLHTLITEKRYKQREQTDWEAYAKANATK